MVADEKMMTVGQVAKTRGVGGWLIRKIIDELEPHVQRAGLYRLVGRQLLARIDNELRKRRHEGSTGKKELAAR